MSPDYGSAFHLGEYRERFPVALDSAILTAVRRLDGSLHWLYPDGPREKEPQGVDFLDSDHPARTRWKSFWPQSGRQQSWDGLARLDSPTSGSEWILIEAKANHPELTGAPSRAKEEGLKQIELALGEARQFLGVHRHYCWTASYYQYANRLALLYFLRQNDIDARCVFVYFTGDRFPDRRPCPVSESAWRTLLDARDATLGLPQTHKLSAYIHKVFLPVASEHQQHQATPAGAKAERHSAVIDRDDFLSVVRVVAAAIKPPKSKRKRGATMRQPPVTITIEGDRLIIRCGDVGSQTAARGDWTSPVLVEPSTLIQLLKLEKPDESQLTVSFEGDRLIFGPYSLIACLAE